MNIRPQFHNQIKNININKAALTNNKIAVALKQAADFLANCIQHRIAEVYDNYSPKVYQRTYGLYNSLSVDDVCDIVVEGTTLSIMLRFDEKAYHKSLFSEAEVNTALLLNDGYRVKKDVWFKNIEYFGYRDGAHFVEQGIEDFNRLYHGGIKVKINVIRPH